MLLPLGPRISLRRLYLQLSARQNVELHHLQGSWWVFPPLLGLPWAWGGESEPRSPYFPPVFIFQGHGLNRLPFLGALSGPVTLFTKSTLGLTSFSRSHLFLVPTVFWFGCGFQQDLCQAESLLPLPSHLSFLPLFLWLHLLPCTLPSIKHTVTKSLRPSGALS